MIIRLSKCHPKKETTKITNENKKAKIYVKGKNRQPVAHILSCKFALQLQRRKETNQITPETIIRTIVIFTSTLYLVGERCAVADGTRADFQDNLTCSGLMTIISGFSIDMRGGTGIKIKLNCYGYLENTCTRKDNSNCF